MIISASRRTDIPRFYFDWLLNRLGDGFASVSYTHLSAQYCFLCPCGPFSSFETKIAADAAPFVRSGAALRLSLIHISPSRTFQAGRDAGSEPAGREKKNGLTKDRSPVEILFRRKGVGRHFVFRAGRGNPCDLRGKRSGKIHADYGLSLIHIWYTRSGNA